MLNAYELWTDRGVRRATRVQLDCPAAGQFAIQTMRVSPRRVAARKLISNSPCLVYLVHGLTRGLPFRFVHACTMGLLHAEPALRPNQSSIGFQPTNISIYFGHKFTRVFIVQWFSVSVNIYGRYHVQVSYVSLIFFSYQFILKLN